MKKLIYTLCLYFLVTQLYGQENSNDFGRIILNTYLPDNVNVPNEAKNLLITKLNQITSINGLGGSQINGRFIITVNINIGSKDIIPGPPQLIAQNLDITFFVGDAVSNNIYSNVTISTKGVGTNENKAFLEAFKLINPKNKEIVSFLENGKNKIIEYYSNQCDFIIKDAKTLVSQEKYNEAIYTLALVPEVCQSCYYKCLDTLSNIFQQKIDSDCKIKLKEARIIWSSNQTPTGAEKVGEILRTIDANASYQSEVNLFIKQIDSKLKADEKAKWQFKMKQYDDKIAAQKEKVRIAEDKNKRDDIYRENQSQRDAIYKEKQSKRNFELDKINSSNAREIAVEYARNQPKSVTYNKIFWR